MYLWHDLRWLFPGSCPLVGLRGGWRAFLMKSESLKMAHPKKTKRSHSDSDDSEQESTPVKATDQLTSIHFPRFLVVEAEDSSESICKKSPFAIEKQLNGILGTPKSVKKLKNDTLLIEVFNKQQAANLLQHTTFLNTDVKIYPHKSLNSCKGVIRCRDLSYCDSIEVVKENLASQGVTEVKRIQVNRDGFKVDTHTYILTFSSSNLPSTIKIGFLSVKVDVYVPNPLRCFKCQRFGHHITKCPNSSVCAKCGNKDEGHDSENCSNSLKCVNCSGTHATFSRECPAWKDEKEVLSIKYSRGLSFPEARRIVEENRKSQQGSSTSSYASAASPSPAPVRDNCSSCHVLAKILLAKFPDMADKLKGLVPAAVILSATKQPAPTNTKPTTPATKPKSSSTPSQTKSKTSNSSNPSKKTSKPVSSSPAQAGKISDSSVKTSKKSSQKKSVTVEVAVETQKSSMKTSNKDGSKNSSSSSSIPTSNKFEKLDDMDVEECEETLEGYASESEAINIQT